jgi:hypothetical protein
MKYYLNLLVLSLISLIIVGCSASSHIVVGQTRPPISPSMVKLYSKAPAKYEEIAIIDSSSKSSWAITDQGKVDVAIERLKEEAASLGANGILIQLTGDISTGSVGVGSATAYGNSAYGYGISSSVLHKVAKGMAIYVY